MCIFDFGVNSPFSPHTQYEANHGAEVASPTAEVEEGEARLEIQSLHHLRVDTWSR